MLYYTCMLIGICGLIGNGKGTVADYLVENHKFEKLSFADSLKDGVSAVFGWDREMLEGETVQSRKWREEIDLFWTKETGRDITPRLVLQLFGTDCMRNGFFDGIWVSLVKQKITQNPDKNYVIPDCRFYNELQMVTDLGGQAWEVWKSVKRPDWWETAKKDNTENTNNMGKNHPEVHASEWRWAGWDFNATINNTGTIDELYEHINQALDHQQ